MESEIKFQIPDAVTAAQLREQHSLAGFTVGAWRDQVDHDRYLDTADHRLLRAGWALRLRATAGGLIATLKGLGSAEGAWHRREEREISVPGEDPASWPDGDLRSLVQELCGDEPLLERFSLRQQRSKAILVDGEHQVAELSLDTVWYDLVPGQVVYELEAELQPDGSEADLARLSAWLSEAWRLQPQPESKFSRGLGLAGTRREG